MKVLVTGVTGFIGSHLCEYLLKKGMRVVGIDKKMNSNLLELNLKSLLDGVQIVFHLAAQTGVQSSWGKDFRDYSDDNILATQKLLEACRGSSIHKFIYASSSSVYGDTNDIPMREGSALCPISPYGVSKLAGEHLCSLYYKNFGISTVSLRYFTVYGERQRPDMAFYRFFKWALEDKPLTIYGDGEQSRDFTHVDDIIEATWMAGKNGSPGEVFNIGGGSHISLNQVIPIIQEIVGRKIEVRYERKQRGDVRHTFADITKAQNKLGYKPKMSLKDGLRQEYEWILRDC